MTHLHELLCLRWQARCVLHRTVCRCDVQAVQIRAPGDVLVTVNDRGGAGRPQPHGASYASRSESVRRAGERDVIQLVR